MGKTKVVQQTYYPGGEPQKEALQYSYLLQQALLPALFQIYVPELAPLAQQAAQRSVGDLATRLGVSPPTVPTGEQIFETLRQRTEVISQPLLQAAERAEQDIGLRRDILKQLATAPMENPYTQAVIDAMRRRMEEETRRGIEQLGTAFELAGVSRSSAFPQQSRLLAERGLTTLQENISNLMADIFERQRQTQLQALQMLSALPAAEVELGRIRSGIASMPYDVVSSMFGDIGGLSQQLQQGVAVSQVVRPSLFSQIVGGIGSLGGAIALGALGLGSLGLLGSGGGLLGGAAGTALPAAGLGYYLGYPVR